MSKITRTEYLDNIRNIINEGMSNTANHIGTSRFNITKHITSLLEEAHRDPKLMDYLMRWNNGLKSIEPGTEYRNYRQFAEGLMVYQKGNIAVKNVINEINECLKDHAHELEIYCAIDNINDPLMHDEIREAYTDYLADDTEDNHKLLIEALWPSIENNDPAALHIMSVLSDNNSVNKQISGYMVESIEAYNDTQKALAKQREEMKINRIKRKLENYVEEVFEQAKVDNEKKALEEKMTYCLAGLANNNNIGLSEAIKSIAASDAKKNAKLMETIEQYAGALNTGLYEERLYETFLRNMSAYNYMLPVEKAINKINENVAKNKVCIEITKLLEEMSESTSWQILPLIEEDCARYAKNPTPNNRVQVRNCLMQFATDPYCYQILEIINNDNSKEANMISERVMSIKDNVKLIRSHAETSHIYSPIQFIKEGECVFNANGNYFVKKNNTISKLNQELISQLSEKFITLCKLTNDPHVTINEDCIILADNDKVAEIHEGYVDINGVRETTSTLRNLNEMCMKYDFDTNFFIMCSCLHENFNNIARVNFGTHIALKENLGINVDMFRLGDNIFINTVNEDTQTSTFYHNVNPLQCKNIINSHMGINVSSLFESLLPAQDKIMMRLNETLDAYIESINKLETTIDKLKKEKDKLEDEDAIKKLEDGIEMAEDKLKDIKSEYKEWQKKVEYETGEDMGADDDETSTDDVNIDDEEVNGDGDTRKETTAEPLDDSEIEDSMRELSTPINSDETVTDDSEEGEGFNLTDDEFESYLNADKETESDIDFNDGELDDIVTDEVKAATDNAEDTISDKEPSDILPDADEDITDIIGDEANTEEIDADELSDDNVISSDDEAFDEIADDEIEIETPAEEISDEDDIIINDTDAEVDATDVFGGDTEDPLDDEKTPDVEMPKFDTVLNVNDEAMITKVLFDENIKTGEKYRSGTVSVITPMISGEGELYNKSEDFKFYLNDEGAPVIDCDDMSATLYRAIVGKIQAEPNYNTFVETGVDRIKKEEVKPVEVESRKIDKVIIPNDDEDLLPDTVEISENPFKVTDLPDEFSIEADFEDPTDDEDEVIVADKAEDDVLPSDNDKLPFIPTYTIGDTEIELPASNVDDTIIPESVNVKITKKTVNENRKAIKGIKAAIKNQKGTHFFVNEGSVKPSKMNSQSHVNSSEEKFDGVRFNDGSSLVENYNPDLDPETIEKLYHYARNFAIKAGALTGDVIHVSTIKNYLMNKGKDVTDEYNPLYFTITKTNTEDIENNSYTVYRVGNEVFYRPTFEFDNIITDLINEVPEQIIAALEYSDDAVFDPINVDSSEDCKFAMKAIIQSLIGDIIKDDGLLEKCKIRKTKLSTGGDIEKSKLVDDILHGDKEERDFKNEVEKDTKAAGIDNPLAPMQPAQEEAYVPVLPNAHRKMNISEMLELYDFVFEANDHVIYNKIKAEVIEVSEDGSTAEIKLKDGNKIKVATKDLEPDPEYINDLNAPDTEHKSLDMKIDGSKDIESSVIGCNIMVDGQQINGDECYAYLSDVIESKHMIRVMNEGHIEEYSVDNVDFTELPFACIVNADGEPIRKVRIYPESYVNAEPNDLVKCICGDKETQYPKRVINILS